jgi:hypothetical protein
MKFVQLCARNLDLYALSEDGQVYLLNRDESFTRKINDKGPVWELADYPCEVH